MGYLIEGVDYEADEEGYLVEANYSDAAPPVIAEAEGDERRHPGGKPDASRRRDRGRDGETGTARPARAASPAG